MKKHFILAILLLAFVSAGMFGQTIELRFNKNKQFKIAQFTDLHWSHQSPGCAQTTKTIKYVLDTEKPDLAILTGDIITDVPAKEGWLAVAKIFADAKIPWAIVLGNHDAEPGITRDGIFELLKGLPWFVGEKGPELYGCGNYALPVYGSGSGNQTAALLYLIDSNDYPPVSRLGHYDWIHFEQIEWYRQQSKEFTRLNSGTPLPALAFFHIPILEYGNVVGRNTTIGNGEEDVAGANINSGIFASMVEMGDMMGVFAGHDHDNDYIGIEQDIALAFGRVTGADAYGKLERGSRIITLYEDKFKFDTWIRTKKGTEFQYYYPSGLSAMDEQEMDYLPALKGKPSKQGVRYSYYEGKFKSTSDFASSKAVKQGILDNFALSPATTLDFFAFEFKTWIKIPERGVYKFYTWTDDGSKLLIDGKTVVDNDGSHSTKRVEGKVALEAGFHELKLLYFEDYMGQMLEVGFSSKDMRETIIPNNLLFIPE